jgi:hypothetical protein
MFKSLQDDPCMGNVCNTCEALPKKFWLPSDGSHHWSEHERLHFIIKKYVVALDGNHS